MQRIGKLNGENITYDHDLSTIDLAIVDAGIVSGLAVENNFVRAGKALIKVIRADGREIMCSFENTQDLAMDTSGTKKIFIEIEQSKVNDGSQNNEDGTGIALIKGETDYPLTNTYLPLAEITSGVISDVRVFVNFKENLNVTQMGNIFNSADMLVKLDPDGKIPTLDGSNLTNVNTTSEFLEYSFAAGEDLQTGDALTLASDGKVLKADSDFPEKSEVIGFAKENKLTNETVRVDISGVSDTQTGLQIGQNYTLKNLVAQNHTIEQLLENITADNNTSVMVGYSSSYIYLRQSFLNGTDTHLSSAEFKLAKVGNPTDTLMLELCDMQDNVISQAVETPSESELSTTFTPYTFSFPKTLIQANTSYYLRFKRSGSISSSNYYKVAAQDTNPYADGNVGTSGNGTSWTNRSSDSYFRITTGVLETGKIVPANQGDTVVGRALSATKIFLK